MQYVNQKLKLKSVLGPLFLVVGCLSFVGCASDSSKKNVDAVTAKPTLVSTQTFVPVLKQDKEGVYLPYEPSVNPYAAQSSRLKKESVLAYIDAQRAFDKKKFDVAEVSLRKIIADDSKLSGPWVMLGDIASKQEDYVTAKSHYQEAIRINKDNVNAYLRLALAQRELGEFLPAQNTYADALSVWPDFPEAHLNLAILYDIYLNHPIRAQAHLEAYQFLTNENDEKVAKWLEEVQARTGMSIKLKPMLAQEGSDNGAVQ